MRAPINLATNPFVNYRPFVFTVGLLGGAALLLTLLLVVVGANTWKAQASTLARIRELENQRARLMTQQRNLESELRAPATQRMLERARFLNDLIRRKSFSWIELFDDLQQRLPARVRILRLSPALRKDGSLQVELRVGGESAAAVVEFLRALEKGDKFRDLVLASQRQGGGIRQDATVAEVSAVYAQE